MDGSKSIKVSRIFFENRGITFLVSSKDEKRDREKKRREKLPFFNLKGYDDVYKKKSLISIAALQCIQICIQLKINK